MDLHTEGRIDCLGHELHNCICSPLHSKYKIKEGQGGDPSMGALSCTARVDLTYVQVSTCVWMKVHQGSCLYVLTVLPNFI